MDSACGFLTSLSSLESRLAPRPAKEKLPVGERVAYCALAQQYRKKVVYQGPTLASVDRLAGSIRLRFAHTIVAWW
jgi:hypothetical protein